MLRLPQTLKHTTPVPWSRVGGVATFKAHPTRTGPAQAALAEFQREAQQGEEALRKLRRNGRKALLNVEQHRRTIEKGGVASVSKFCLDMAEERQLRREEVRTNRRRAQQDGQLSGRGNSTGLLRTAEERKEVDRIASLPPPPPFRREDPLKQHLPFLPNASSVTAARKRAKGAGGLFGGSGGSVSGSVGGTVGSSPVDPLGPVPVGGGLTGGESTRYSTSRHGKSTTRSRAVMS